jgi:glycosyltransferase involved in cell wall biosynthesis
MTSSIYVTFDFINQNTGAGQVCWHEVEALRRVSDVQQVITRQDIAPKLDRFYGFNPFLYDYFASQMIVPDTVDLAHFSCSPTMSMLSRLRPEKYVINVVAHDLKTSIEEHERVTGQKYPFFHNTDKFLHDSLLAHVKDADVVFTPSEGSAKWIRENLSPETIEVIPHGLDYPEEPASSPDDFHIAYIGAWGPDKGVIYLLRAWSQLNYSDSTLFFFGLGSKRMKPALESIATGGLYHLAGAFDKLSDIMPRYSVYVHTSVTEGFGMTVTECMSYGKPVVVTEGTGCSYLVEDGRDGLVIPIRNPQAIADAIQYFKDNPSEIERMGKNARETAEKLSWDKIERRYEEVYIRTSE